MIRRVLLTAILILFVDAVLLVVLLRRAFWWGLAAIALPAVAGVLLLRGRRWIVERAPLLVRRTQTGRSLVGAALLLIIPGPITDVLALALFVPVCRRWMLQRWTAAWSARFSRAASLYDVKTVEGRVVRRGPRVDGPAAARHDDLHE